MYRRCFSSALWTSAFDSSSIKASPLRLPSLFKRKCMPFSPFRILQPRNQGTHDTETDATASNAGVFQLRLKNEYSVYSAFPQRCKTVSWNKGYETPVSSLSFKTQHGEAHLVSISFHSCIAVKFLSLCCWKLLVSEVLDTWNKYFSLSVTLCLLYFLSPQNVNWLDLAQQVIKPCKNSDLTICDYSVRIHANITVWKDQSCTGLLVGLQKQHWSCN